VLEDVLELAGKQLQHSGVNVERAWGTDVPTIYANPNLLKAGFLNMILNAIDANARGRNVADIRQRCSDQDQREFAAATSLAAQNSATPGKVCPQRRYRDSSSLSHNPKSRDRAWGYTSAIRLSNRSTERSRPAAPLGVGTTFTISLPLRRKEETIGEIT